MEGIKGLKAYKSTGTSKKVDSAKTIIDAINQKSIEIDAIGFTGKTNGNFVTWACDAVNRANQSLGGKWEGTQEYFDWDGHKLNNTEILKYHLLQIDGK
ncbi:MAG: hypothetical protein R2783_10480 [Gelidibacter sp.]